MRSLSVVLVPPSGLVGLAQVVEDGLVVVVHPPHVVVALLDGLPHLALARAEPASKVRLELLHLGHVERRVAVLQHVLDQAGDGEGAARVANKKERFK